MTGSWLIAKWVGVSVLTLYLLLILVAVWRFRTKLSRLGGGLYLPMVFGNFVSLSVPSVFESVAVTHVCFVIAQAVYFVGIVILVRGLSRADQGSLLKADNMDERIQSLKLN